MTRSQTIYRRGSMVTLALCLAVLLWILGNSLLGDPPSDGRPRPVPAPGPTMDDVPVGSDGNAAANPTGGSILSTADRNLDLHGLVIDGRGRPVAGAEVKAFSHHYRDHLLPRRPGPERAVLRARTATNALGEFRLRLESGEQVSLSVRAEGHVPLEVYRATAGERLLLRLPPATRLVVLVTQEGDGPSPGAWIEASGTVARDRTGFRAHGTADEAGRWTFSAVPADSDLTLRVQGTPPWRVEKRGIRTPPEGELEVEVELPRGRLLTGLVLDAQNGAGIAGAGLRLRGRYPGQALSGEDGRFVLEGWTGRDGQELVVAARGYADRRIVVKGDGRLVVPLTRELIVTGTVLDASRQPLAGVRVSVVGHRSADGVWSDTSATGESDAEGRFRLVGLDRTFGLAARFTAPGHGRIVRVLTTPPQGSSTMDLGAVVLPEGRTVAGRTVYQDGRPAARRHVRLTGSNPDRGRSVDASVGPVYGATEWRRTDDLGRFTFTDLAPGEYRLTVRQGTTSVEERVNVDPGGDPEETLLTLRPDWSLRILVRDEEAAPVPGIFVRCELTSGASFARTDSEGVATLSGAGLPRSILLSGRDSRGRLYLDASSTISEPPPEELRITVARAGVARGVVLGPEFEPVKWAIVEARREGVTVARAEADEDGRFELAVPAVGLVDVVYAGAIVERHRGGAFSRRALRQYGILKRIGPGPENLEIRAEEVTAPGILHVRVLAGGEAAPPALRIGVRDATGREIRHALTDERGRCSFGNLPRGELAVGLSARPHLPLRGLQRGFPDRRTLTLRTPSDWLICGRVEDGSGSRAGRVEAYRGPILVASCRTDGRGTFALFLGPVNGEAVRLVASVVGADGSRLRGEVASVRPGERKVHLVVRGR